MNLLSVTFQPKAWVTFSPDEIELLVECSQKHYDGVCQRASQVGGFLYGIVNASSVFPDNENQLTWRELDTLAKIAEQSQFLELDKAQRGMGIQLAIRKILNKLNEITPPKITNPGV